MRYKLRSNSVVGHISRHAVAYVALFVSLGGTSYAALALPANSVGTKQIRNNAVTVKKINAAARAALKGQRGPQGPIGIHGIKGDKGDPGRSALTPLAAGETEIGIYAVGGPAYTPGSSFIDPVTFPIPRSAALDSAHVVYVAGSSAPHCPGRGMAASGYLCLYETTHSSIDLSSLKVLDPTDSTGMLGASREGFIVAVSSIGTNPFVYAWGTWATTG